MSDQFTARSAFFIAACAGSIAAFSSAGLAQSTAPGAADQAGTADLVVDAHCDNANPGERVATFRWPAQRGASQVEIDVTQYYNGWDRGQFQTIARLEGGVSQFSWRGGEPGIDYLWRVRSYVNGSWVASAPARYQTPICPVDYGPGIEDGEERDPVK